MPKAQSISPSLMAALVIPLTTAGLVLSPVTVVNALVSCAILWSADWFLKPSMNRWDQGIGCAFAGALIAIALPPHAYGAVLVATGIAMVVRLMHIRVNAAMAGVAAVYAAWPTPLVGWPTSWVDATSGATWVQTISAGLSGWTPEEVEAAFHAKHIAGLMAHQWLAASALCALVILSFDARTKTRASWFMLGTLATVALIHGAGGGTDTGAGVISHVLTSGAFIAAAWALTDPSTLARSRVGTVTTAVSCGILIYLFRTDVSPHDAIAPAVVIAGLMGIGVEHLRHRAPSWRPLIPAGIGLIVLGLAQFMSMRWAQTPSSFDSQCFVQSLEQRAFDNVHAPLQTKGMHVSLSHQAGHTLVLAVTPGYRSDITVLTIFDSRTSQPGCSEIIYHQETPSYVRPVVGRHQGGQLSLPIDGTSGATTSADAIADAIAVSVHIAESHDE